MAIKFRTLRYVGNIVLTPMFQGLGTRPASANKRSLSQAAGTPQDLGRLVFGTLLFRGCNTASTSPATKVRS